MLVRFVSLLLFVSVAFAALPSGTVTCGDNDYSVSELEAAISAGLQYYESNNLQGLSFRNPRSHFLWHYFMLFLRWLPSSILQVNADVLWQWRLIWLTIHSESSEHIKLYCSGDGPWLEVLIQMPIFVFFSHLLRRWRSFLLFQVARYIRPHRMTISLREQIE